jgi:membrane peptidoglycan carboxypeptidase
MVLALEDKRFWLHFGVDPIAIARALLMLTRERGRLQGGSAIAEQLIKMRCPALRSRSFLGRGVRAALGICLTLSAKRSHLLRHYLDRVYFGRNFYGSSAASLGYFSVPITEVSAAHSFFLAERIALPNSFRPMRIQNILSRQIVRYVLGAEITSLPGLYGRWFGTVAEGEVQVIVRRFSP